MSARWTGTAGGFRYNMKVCIRTTVSCYQLYSSSVIVQSFGRGFGVEATNNLCVFVAK